MDVSRQLESLERRLATSAPLEIVVTRAEVNAVRKGQTVIVDIPGFGDLEIRRLPDLAAIFGRQGASPT